MKKLAMLLVACALTCGLSACSGGQKTEAPQDANQSQASAEKVVYAGTWTAAGIERDGKYLSREELEAVGNTNISDMYIMLQDGGKGVFHFNGEDKTGEWKETESGVQFGMNNMIEKDGKLLFSSNGETAYFEKTSDNQEAPESKSAGKEGQAEKNGDKGSAAKSKAKATDWKTFLKQYDKFVDEYVDLVQKMKKNSSDTTLVLKAASLATEAAQWAEKAERLEDDLSDEEALEYATKLLKIEQKLAKALV